MEKQSTESSKNTSRPHIFGNNKKRVRDSNHQQLLIPRQSDSDGAFFLTTEQRVGDADRPDVCPVFLRSVFDGVWSHVVP